ncbi:MAG: hypothetical protein ACD_2C00138G0001 [uncultured bacterium (gcode 4)]|uniref:ABC transporter ATP-binding protein n=1 Tax=uncultured bacterium (gcode 4) TaxID=1234023 RepID=K2G333_9BACT|nr:MAG: hypothetical protein ACD_2C00138G0001 [uncultured bacterium (gcode 4)]
MKNSILKALKPYALLISLLIIFTLTSDWMSLIIPRVISTAIDSFGMWNFDFNLIALEFLAIAILIFIFTYLQSLLQVYASEKFARDLRSELIWKISTQDYGYIEDSTPEKLLTNLTSDVDAVKTFISQAIASIVSSIFLIIGASTLLLLINWKLALAVLMIIPLIGGTFYFMFKNISSLFTMSQENIDKLNRIITESILGSPLIRILNSQWFEFEKFTWANSDSRKLWLRILKLFASLIPIIILISNSAVLIILLLWGYFVIQGSMSLWDFAAFNSYRMILIFPIIMIWFMSSVISRAEASYERISEVLNVKPKEEANHASGYIDWWIELKDISLRLWEKEILKDISFKIEPKKKIAIIGPTASWKTQLLYLIVRLLHPTSWEIRFGWTDLSLIDRKTISGQVSLVFQDSIIFNLSLRENIAFTSDVSDEDLEKAIKTAEIDDFINSLPNKLDSVISERWTSLSWWQKQRLMLARALATNPKLLLLDDFTARLDMSTERKILENIENNYPELTLVSVTQKIEPIKDYDQIILLMEGEILGTWKHSDLMKTSTEYVQIYNSQQSTNELRS